MFENHGNTTFTFRGKPFRKVGLYRSLDWLNSSQQLSSLHLSTLTVEEIIRLLKKRGDSLFALPAGITIH